MTYAQTLLVEMSDLHFSLFASTFVSLLGLIPAGTLFYAAY